MNTGAALAEAGTPAPLLGHQPLVLLLQLAALLGTALVLGRVAKRLGFAPVVGELCAGVVLGPSLLAHVAPGFSAWLFTAGPARTHTLDAIGQIGVLLLVGITGMNLDLGLVRRKGAAVGWVSAGGLLVPLAAGVGLGFVLPASLLAGDRLVFACFLGVALCVSAIPVIAKTLLELRMLHRDIGQVIVSSAAVDDFAGWVLLSVVAMMATTGVRVGQLGRSVLFLALILLVTCTVGRVAVRWLLAAAVRSREPGVSLTAAVLVIVLCAAATHTLQMEAAFGAFLAGLMISASGLRDTAWTAPLRTFVMAVLAPLFFATAGFRVDLAVLGDPAVLASAAAVLAVAVTAKFAGVYLTARITRFGHWEALALGAGLNVRGAIEMIIAMVGLQLGVLTVASYTIIVLVAILTSMTAPMLLRLAVRRIDVTAEERVRERLLLPEPVH